MKLPNSNGFSLIELMIALTIIFFAAGCTIATYRIFDHLITQSDLFSLAIFCQKVRADALAHYKENSIVFNTTNNGYQTEKTTVSLSKQTNFGAPYDALGPPSAPTNKITQLITFQNNTLICYPDGHMNAGIIYLTSTDKMSGYALSNGVGDISYLRLYSYTGSSWKSIE